VRHTGRAGGREKTPRLKRKSLTSKKMTNDPRASSPQGALTQDGKPLVTGRATNGPACISAASLREIGLKARRIAGCARRHVDQQAILGRVITRRSPSEISGKDWRA